MVRMIKIIVVSVTILAIVAIAASAYMAASDYSSENSQPESQITQRGPVSNPGVVGEVSAVLENSIALVTPQGGSLTILVREFTAIRSAEANAPASLNDIQPGNVLQVLGQPQGSGTIIANTIVILPAGAVPGSRPGAPQAPGGPPAAGSPQAGPAGEVITINNNQINLRDPAGREIMVKVSEQTQVRLVESQALGNLDDIQPGIQIQVQGQPEENGGFQAQVILVLPEGDHLAGRILEIGQGQLIIETPQGQATIFFNEDTQIRTRLPAAPGNQLPGETGLNTGSFIHAYGVLNPDGTLTARLILISPEPQPGGQHPAGPQGNPPLSP